MARPRVMLFNAVSLDGRTTGFEVDQGLFYGLAGRFPTDTVLAGSATILDASRGCSDGDDPPGAPESEALLAIVDHAGRIKNWCYWRAQPYWGRFLAIGSAATPPAHLDYLAQRGVEFLAAGPERVDLRLALDALYARGSRQVRVESGGRLGSVLVRDGLVDEIKLLVHPTIVGGNGPRWLVPEIVTAPIGLRQRRVETLGPGLVLVEYEVAI